MKERTKKIFLRILHVNTYLTLSDLSKEFYISERTLRNEIVTINEYLEERRYSPIVNLRRQGLKLSLLEKDKKIIISNLSGDSKHGYYTPNERFLILILEIANSSKITLLYEMEKLLDISKSTMDEDMRKLRKYSEKYGVKVISLPKQGVKFYGDERTIRTMLYDVVNSIININNIGVYKDTTLTTSEKLVLEYLGEELISDISIYYGEIFKQCNIEVNQVYRKQIILFIGIWIRRLEQGNIINRSINRKEELKEGPIKMLIDKLCEKVQLIPSLNEIRYISFIIETYNPKDMSNSLDWMTAQFLTIQLIDYVEQQTSIPFSNDDDLYEGLYKHIIGLLSRLKNNLQAYNPLKNIIKESYVDTYKVVESFTKRIEEQIKRVLSEDEVCFLTIYFSTSKSRIQQGKQYVYQAVVVCNHGVSIGNLLAENLKEEFNIEIVAVLSLHELEFIKKLDVNLVFTTIPFEYQKKSVLLLNPIIRESDKKAIKVFLEEHKESRRVLSQKIDSTKLLKDVLRIIVDSGGTVTEENYRSLEDIFKKYNLQFNKREIQPMIQDVLKNSGILLNVECFDWRAAIRKVAKPLLNDLVIKESYIDTMINSVEEYGPYIVIGKHLALAHARPEDGVNELGISVMTLKEPVYFGNEDNDPVKIIFCLAAIDSYSHLNIMKNLVELINDEDKLDKLIKSKDIEAFNKLLYGGV